MKQSKSRLATIAVIVSGVLWGVISIFIKALLAHGLSLMQIVFMRMLFSSLFIGAFILIKNRKWLKFELKDIWMFIGSGILSLFMYNCCYFYSVAEGYTSVGVVLMYTSPIFITIMSILLFKEKITARKLIALAITFAGTTMVSGIVGSSNDVPLRIIASGLCSGLTYGMYTIFNKFALAKYSTTTATFYSFVFALSAMAPFANIPQLASAMAIDPIGLLWVAGIGLVCTIAPYFLYNWGLTIIDSSKAGILCSTEPLVGSMLGMIAYKESHEPIKVLGIICIICAIIALNAPSAKEKHKN